MNGDEEDILEELNSPKKIKTPQEKKRLSLMKDRRNCYGESRAAARHSIRRNKKLPTRAYRHKISQTLINASKNSELENVEELENLVRATRRRDWKKFPDAPLINWIKNRFEYRKRMFRARINRQLKKEDK